MGDAKYLRALEKTLPDLLENLSPDLVLYDAGVDVHEDDRLGRLKITTRGMRQRDQFVISECLDRGVAIATVIGGGYHQEHENLARRHAVIVKTAVSMWQNYPCKIRE